MQVRDVTVTDTTEASYLATTAKTVSPNIACRFNFIFLVIALLCINETFFDE